MQRLKSAGQAPRFFSVGPIAASQQEVVPFTNKPWLTFDSPLPLRQHKGLHTQLHFFPSRTLLPIPPSHMSSLSICKPWTERGHDIYEQPPSSTDPSPTEQQKRNLSSRAERSEYHVGAPNSGYGKRSTSSGAMPPSLRGSGPQRSRPRSLPGKAPRGEGGLPPTPTELKLAAANARVSTERREQQESRPSQLYALLSK